MSDHVAILGTRRTMKELVDGTIRVQIDIDPPYRAAFLAQFGQIDMPVALAAVTAQAAMNAPQPERGNAEKPAGQNGETASKGGALSKLAAMWCRDSAFQSWLIENFEPLWESFERVAPEPEQRARAVICGKCGITSRAELDNNHHAGGCFNQEFRTPYSEYLKEHG